MLIILFNCTVCYSAGQNKSILNQYVSEEETKQLSGQLHENAKNIYKLENGKRPIDEIVDDLFCKSMVKGLFNSIDDFIQKGNTDKAIENLNIAMQLLKKDQLKTKYYHYGNYLCDCYTMEAMIENAKDKPDYLKSLDSIKRAIKEYPDTKNFQTWFTGGLALYGMERHKESVTYLTQALKLSSNNEDKQRTLYTRALAAGMTSDPDLITKVAYPDSKALINEDKNIDSQIYYVGGVTASMAAQYAKDKPSKLIAANDCITYLSKVASSGYGKIDPNLESKITQCRVSKDEAQQK